MTQMGRPSKLGHIVDPATGTTTGDRIVALIRTGNYIETAAAAAGINKVTLYDWMREGARLSTDIAEGRKTRNQLSKHQRDLIDFSNAVVDAQADAEARDVTNLARIAAGGIPQTIETVKTDRDGNEVERTVRTEQSLPNAQVLEWRLERRHPTRWGRRQAVEHSGPGGGAINVQVQAEQMYDAVKGILDDLGVPLTDDVRHVVAARLRGMGAAQQSAIPATATDG